MMALGKLYLPREATHFFDIALLESDLELAFGGFTRYEGNGAWVQGPSIQGSPVHKEGVWIYEVYASDHEELAATLRALSRRVRKLAKQATVLYSVTPCEFGFV